MAKKKVPNYYCLHCAHSGAMHSGAMHSGPEMKCGGLDAAGDVCDCSPFVADLGRKPMPENKPTKKKVTSGIKGRNPGDEPIRWPPLPGKRYRIMGDGSGHKYFIEVGDEGVVFEMWLETFEGGWDPEFEPYNGPDFSDRRIDGRFTFTDPRNG